MIPYQDPMYTVIVVDPQDATRTNLSNILGGFGFNVLSARDGLEALHILRSQILANNLAHLLITEVHMPQMDGVEIADMLRRQSIDMPIIFMADSVGRPAKYTRTVLDHFTPYFLEKPIRDVDRLMQTIFEALKVPTPSI